MTYTKEELTEILRVHKAWLASKEDGKRANLRGADLRGADLCGAKNLTPLMLARLRITPAEGAFTGWKKCRQDVLVKVLIPAEAKRSNAPGGRKCRAEFVDVLEMSEGTTAKSMHDSAFLYTVGQRVTPHVWCDDAMQECAGGIHFFISREEALDYGG